MVGNPFGDPAQSRFSREIMAKSMVEVLIRRAPLNAGHMFKLRFFNLWVLESEWEVLWQENRNRQMFIENYILQQFRALISMDTMVLHYSQHTTTQGRMLTEKTNY